MSNQKELRERLWQRHGHVLAPTSAGEAMRKPQYNALLDEFEQQIRKGIAEELDAYMFSYDWEAISGVEILRLCQTAPPRGSDEDL